MNNDRAKKINMALGIFCIALSLYNFYQLIPGLKWLFRGDDSLFLYFRVISLFISYVLLFVFGVQLVVQKFKPAYITGLSFSVLLILSNLAFLALLVSVNNLRLITGSLLRTVFFIFPFALLAYLLTYYKKNMPDLSAPGTEQSAVAAGSETGITMETAGAILSRQYLQRMLIGILIAAAGILITGITYSIASSSSRGGTYTVAWGAMIVGAFEFFRGLFGWIKNR